MDYYENTAVLIDAHHRAGRAPMLWGDPGVGKSDFVKSLCNRGKVLDRGKMVPVAGMINLPTRDMSKEDMLGLPALEPVTVPGEDGKEQTHQLTNFTTMRWFYDAYMLCERTGGVVYVFGDEFSSTELDTQGSLLNVLSEGKLPNGFPVHPRVRFIFAGNKAETEKGVYEMRAALTSRLAHHDFDPDTDSWLAGLVSGFGKPLSARQSQWRAHIAAYLRANEVAITDDPTDTDRSRGWANRRTWTDLADNLAELPDDLGADTETSFQYKTIVSIVGKHHVVELVSYLQDHSLPAPQDILADPSLLDGVTSDIAYAALFNTANYCASAEDAEREKVLGSGASEAEARNTLAARTQSPYLSLISVANYTAGEHGDATVAVITSRILDIVKVLGPSVVRGDNGKRPSFDRDQFGPLLDSMSESEEFLNQARNNT